MIGLLVSVLIACIIFGLLYWLITMIPLPAPFAQVARVILAVIFVIWIIYVLLGLTGGSLGYGHPLLR
jgi:hypothetical protein